MGSHLRVYKMNILTGVVRYGNEMLRHKTANLQISEQIGFGNILISVQGIQLLKLHRTGLEDIFIFMFNDN